MANNPTIGNNSLDKNLLNLPRSSRSFDVIPLVAGLV